MIPEDQTPSTAWTIGSLARTRLSISYLFLPFALALMVQLGWQTGLLFAAIFFVSALLHECGHVVFSRWTGGWADNITIWPLGGFATISPGRSTWSQSAAPWAGPIVNLCICAISIPSLPDWSRALNILIVPQVRWEPLVAADMMQAIFFVNWLMLIANIIPIRPMDGWVIARSFENRLNSSQISLMELFAVSGAIAIAFLGLCIQQSWLVVFGFFLACFHATLGFSRIADPHDQAVDDEIDEITFEASYEDRHPISQSQSSGSFWSVWTEQRHREKEELEAKRREEDEALLDRVLEKVHHTGMNSLSSAERKLLQRVSETYRDRDLQN